MTNEASTPCISFPNPPTLSKIGRDGLVLLAIETELCPVVLPRLLTIFSERGITAFTINAQRDERIQSIEIELAAPGERGRSLLLQEVLRLRNVRRARFGLPPHERGQPIAAKL